MSERFYLTPGGMARLRRRVDEARAAYKAVCDDNPAALEAGDNSGWHDNFAFEENQRQMHQLARRVRDLETLLGRAVVVRLPREVPEKAVLGARVTWRWLDEPGERTVMLAGFDDGDPVAGRVSYNSPLGQALVGAEPGDVRTVRIGDTVRKLEVLDLDCPREEDDACAAV